MGKNEDGTVSKEFKIQIAYITAAFLITVGGAIQANSSMKREVEELKRSNDMKTEMLLRMEGKFDLLNLRIQQLNEKLEARKIVNTTASAFDTSLIVGDQYAERK